MICYLYIQSIAMFLKISIKSYTRMCACVYSHQKKTWKEIYENSIRCVNMVQARVIFLFSKFGIVIVTFIMKTDLFSSTTKPTLIALKKKQTRLCVIRELNQQTVSRLHSCFNVGFKHSCNVC